MEGQLTAGIRTQFNEYWHQGLISREMCVYFIFTNMGYGYYLGCDNTGYCHYLWPLGTVRGHGLKIINCTNSRSIQAIISLDTISFESSNKLEI